MLIFIYQSKFRGNFQKYPYNYNFQGLTLLNLVVFSFLWLLIEKNYPTTIFLIRVIFLKQTCKKGMEGAIKKGIFLIIFLYF